MHIVTHPGKSHTDERISISLILARFGPMSVYRREPSKGELNDANIFVVDVGCQYKPVLRNFDHHQLGPEKDPDCALSLLIKSEIFGASITVALEDQPWLQAIALIDSKGPTAYAESHGYDHFPYDLEGPAELALQWQFEQNTSRSHGLGAERVNKHTCDSLAILGGHLIDRALHEKKHLDKLKAGVQLLEVGELLTGFVAHVDDRRINERFAMEVRNPPLDFAVYPSIRGAGWRITRMTDKVPIDFYQVADDDRVEFAHKGGFTLATKKKISMEECIDLVDKSIVE